MALEVVNAIIGPIVECLLEPIKKHLGYLISCRKNVKKMENKIKELDSNRKDVQTQIEANNRNSIITPDAATEWTGTVDKLMEDLGSVQTDVPGCFNMKQRYMAGKKASEGVEELNELIEAHSKITWPGLRRPLGKVESLKESTSAPLGGTCTELGSRISTFEKALKALDPADPIRMIALHGMGGVGKTTMMEQLENTAKRRKMFKYVVKVVVSQNPNLTSLQNAIAAGIGVTLGQEEQLHQRAARLCIGFEAVLKDKKKDVLLIFDDVWEALDLEKLIGYNPLDKEKSGVKVLLTSRNDRICTEMGGGPNLVPLRIIAMPFEEAFMLFQQITKISSDVDGELYKIAEKIVHKCGGLPLAVKTIAKALLGRDENGWRYALFRLENSELDDDKVISVIQLSLDFLRSNKVKGNELEAIFLLCALFPEDFDIPIEELTSYCVGLRLFRKFHSIAEARTIAHAYVEDLKNANLLMDSSDKVGCVKMHDIVHAFALGVACKGDVHASLIGHGGNLEWPTKDECETLSRISLSCTQGLEIPDDLNFPGLKLLKLMDGDNLFEFPQDFFGRLGNVRVISCYRMNKPLLPSSLPLSTSLQTLCFRDCELIDDLSAIGVLGNLEILSFAGCGVTKLPSSIGGLRKLKLLDVSGCKSLRIDDGVLSNLKKLEELYMRASYGKDVEFTDTNCRELEELSQGLTALEMKFSSDKLPQPKNVCFEKLERFSISISGYLNHLEPFRVLCAAQYEHERRLKYDFRNTLWLNTNKAEVVESKVNKLFHKTEELYLQVWDMNDLSDVADADEELMHLSMKTGGKPMFRNLRVLKVVGDKMEYVFTASLAVHLVLLEEIKVPMCKNLKEIIHYDEGKEEIMTSSSSLLFPRLRSMQLWNLPKLVGFSRTFIDVVEFPHLVELKVREIPKMTSIYGGTETGVTSLVQPPPFNKKIAMPKLEVLDIYDMDGLREIWPSRSCGKDFSALKELKVFSCNSLTTGLFSPLMAKHLKNLQQLEIKWCDGLTEIVLNGDDEGGQEMENATYSEKVFISFPRLQSLELVGLRNLKGISMGMHEFHWPLLEKLTIQACPQMTVFTFGSSTAPKLKYIYSSFGKHSPEGDSYFNLTSTSHKTQWASSSYDGTTANSCPTTTASERIHQLQFPLGCSFSNLIENFVEINDKLVRMFPSDTLLQLKRLENVNLFCCGSLEEVFEVAEEADKDDDILIEKQRGSTTVPFPNLRLMCLFLLKSLRYIWKSQKWTVLEFPNLTKLDIRDCDSLQHVFTCSMVGSLVHLQELRIENCKNMEVIVKEEDHVEEEEVEEEEEGIETRSEGNVIEFPRLKSLTLYGLQNLKGFCLGEHAFALPSLDTLKINTCNKMTVFTVGHSTTPNLKVIHASNGHEKKDFYLRDHGNNINSFVQKEGYFRKVSNDDDEEDEESREDGDENDDDVDEDEDKESREDGDGDDDVDEDEDKESREDGDEDDCYQQVH